MSVQCAVCMCVRVHAAYPRASRIISRTWKCDAYLSRIADRFVIKRYSVTKRIQHSEVYRCRFQKNVRMQTYSATTTTYIRSLSSANHRFDSHCTPFARGVVFFDALVATAQQLQDERRGCEEGNDAKEFLEQLDEESALSFAALADAGTETLILTRFFDDESFDKSKLGVEIPRFLDRIKFLFLDKGCLRTGYTFLMLRNLARPRTLFVGTSAHPTPKTLGGTGKVTSQIVDRVLQRMCNWVALAEAVVQSEFPNFDALNSFTIFNLENGKVGKACRGEGVDGDVARLAQLCGVDRNEMQKQYEDLYPIALRTAKSQTCTTLEAWRQAVQAVQRSHKTKASHPVDAVLPALMRPGAYGGSTSGVERLFSKAHATQNISRSDLPDELVRDELDIICDIDRTEDAEQVEAARDMWLQTYRTSRKHEHERIDAGVPKAAKAEALAPSMMGKCLAGLIRARDAEVGTLAANSDGPRRAQASKVVGEQGWTEQHDKEVRFNKAKRAMALLDAHKSGTILEGEMTKDYLKASELNDVYQLKLSAEYAKRKTKNVHSMADKTDLDLAGKRVYVDSGFKEKDLQELTKLLQQARLRRVTDRSNADVFLTADVNCLGQRASWCLMLGGGYAISWECLLAQGRDGAALCFSCAVAAKRWIWVTRAFREVNPTLTNILTSKMEAQGSNWKWAASMDELKSLGEIRKRNHGGGADLIAFVTKSEKPEQLQAPCGTYSP
jgi:hypothetical protein